MRWRASLTLSLSLWFALSSVVALSVVGVYLYQSLANQFIQRDTAELAGKVDLVRHMLVQIHGRPDIPANRPRFVDAMVGHPGLHLRIANGDGTSLLALSPLPFPATALRHVVDADAVPTAVDAWRAEDGREYRTAVARARMGNGATVLVALALDTSEQQALLAQYRRNLVFVLLCGSVVAALLGWVVAKRGLQPVRVLAQAAYRISASRLDERLNVEHAPSELKQAAAAFNEMLSRLQDSFHRLADFSSDLAHELRTPINNLMGQTQVALSRTRTAEDYRRVLESNAEEYERLARMIDDMLFLAKADHAQASVRRERVDVRAEIDKVVEFYDAYLQDRRLTVACHGTGTIIGDRLLVQRAISNLLSNAIRHTPPAGDIGIVVDARADAVELRVANPGPGIAPGHLPRVFDRFYRVERAGAGTHDGTGLGLAIVQSIARLHGGTVSVDSEPAGLTAFTLRFPTQTIDDGARGDPPLCV